MHFKRPILTDISLLRMSLCAEHDRLRVTLRLLYDSTREIKVLLRRKSIGWHSFSF